MIVGLDSDGRVNCTGGVERQKPLDRPPLLTRLGLVPELPDVTAYLTALEPRVVGQRLERIRLASPFVLRSVDPPVAEVEGRQVVGLRRVGKRIVLVLEGEIFLVIHLMIAGRLHWRPAGARTPGRVG